MDQSVYPLIKGFPDTIEHAWEFSVPTLTFKPKRLAVVGMGANYNAALLLREMLREEIPIEVYQRPFLVEDDTLVIFMSYSGNTKEVLYTFNKVKASQRVVVCSGGKLLEEAEKKKSTIISLPDKLHSRFTFSECFFPVLKFLQENKIIKKRDTLLKKIVSTLKKNEKKLEEEAKHLALNFHHKTFLLYATPFFFPTAYRFQSSLEEDVKKICHANTITELFHNELEALPSEDYFPLLFVDESEVRPYKKQLAFFKKQIGSFFYFGYSGYSNEERTFLAFYLAYFLAFYLGLIYENEVPMGETPRSDDIKKQ